MMCACKAMHLVYRALERNPVPVTLPADMIPPSKRKRGSGLAGAVAVIPAASVLPAASSVIPGAALPVPAAGPVVPMAGAGVPLMPGTPAVPVSTAGRASPTSVCDVDCFLLLSVSLTCTFSISQLDRFLIM